MEHEKTEKFLHVSKCIESNKVVFAAATFQDRARTWWNTQVATSGSEAVTRKTWAEMKCPGIGSHGTKERLGGLYPLELSDKYQSEKRSKKSAREKLITRKGKWENSTEAVFCVVKIAIGRKATLRLIVLQRSSQEEVEPVDKYMLVDEWRPQLRTKCVTVIEPLKKRTLGREGWMMVGSMKGGDVHESHGRNVKIVALLCIVCFKSLKVNRRETSGDSACIRKDHLDTLGLDVVELRMLQRTSPKKELLGDMVLSMGVLLDTLPRNSSTGHLASIMLS
ncbi:hypothetical protein Tco_0843319 [Tanacetum coccineum]|uniref:Retrotransposon gag domain-containing protein n=1 Tax=Tanacetum coccineum TaxID=301880 RepID=A0ABQ5B4K7_9ASTR